jgi:hypothetical protein
VVQGSSIAPTAITAVENKSIAINVFIKITPFLIL